MEAAPDVIVVDDASAIRDMLGLVIGQAGLTHRTAASIDEVCRLPLRGSRSLVLLDLALDRSDAVDVMRHLAAIGFEGSVAPMSGQDESVLGYVSELGREMSLNILPPLRKPFRVDAVRRILREACPSAAAARPVDLAEALKQGMAEIRFTAQVDLNHYEAIGFECSCWARGEDRKWHEGHQEFPGAPSAGASGGTAILLREAIAAWNGLARIGIVLSPSLGISSRDLADPAVLEVVKSDTPKDPRWPGVVLKVSEPELIDQSREVREAVVRLQLHRVRFALAEFSALVEGRVRSPEFRVCEVIVEPRFVQGCATDGERRRICSAAVELGRRLDVPTISEGVSHPADLATVRQLGFRVATGELFSRAMPYGTLASVLGRREPLYARPAKTKA